MELSAVSYRYARGGPWLLRDVTVTVPPAVVVEVTGRNGVGKSTLLRLLAGVVRPGRGRISGRPAAVGWVPERFPAEQPFTVADYLHHMSRLRGLRSDVRARDWAERLHLQPFLGVRLPDLSKGSAQKVGLVQALIAEPELLLLDEPWSGLDQDTRREIPSVVAEAVARGASVVISDHEQRAGRLIASRRWHIADGSVRVYGSGTEPTLAVLEVVVPAAEAESAMRRLREEGRDVRRLR